MDLNPLARKYIWWQPPQVTLRDRRHFVAHVMNIGTLPDVEALRAAIGDEELKRALREARAGEFSERSWHYWQLVLGLAKPHGVPPLPRRNLT